MSAAAPQTAVGPAVAMIDVGVIPAGLKALDALLKEAEVEVVAAGTVQSGRYLILFGGDVEPVERAFLKARQAAGRAVRDSVLLPYAEERIVPALYDGVVRQPAAGDTAGVIQTASPPTLLAAVDAALKGAWVELVELRASDGLGGTAVATLWGETHDVEAAIELAELAISRGGAEWSSAEVIRNADPGVAGSLSPTSRFFKEWRG
ncbi:MAG: hypothetical protein CSA66_00960 [Proteobacteria bacterium]|nr:MAG: hypothetical protein CSA66_00960 [Pseudomonadota bacterium]